MLIAQIGYDSVNYCIKLYNESAIIMGVMIGVLLPSQFKKIDTVQPE